MHIFHVYILHIFCIDIFFLIIYIYTVCCGVRGRALASHTDGCGGSESTIIVGPSKSVLVYALNSLECVLGLARFRVFVPKLYYM